VLLARLPCVDSAPQKRSGVTGPICRFTELPVQSIPVPYTVPVPVLYRYSGRRRAVVRGVRWWAGMVVRFVCVNRVPCCVLKCPVCPVFPACVPVSVASRATA
jgi:hypothetical protein